MNGDLASRELERLERLKAMPRQQQRDEIGYTPVADRSCGICKTPFAEQPAYFHGNYYSKPTCGDCAVEVRYQRYLDYPYTDRPALSKALWLERFASARLPNTKTCEVCGHEVASMGYRRGRRAHVFCSYDCDHEFTNRKRRAPKVERPCIVCGELFTPKRRDGKTCSDRHRKALSRMDATAAGGAAKRDEEWLSQNAATARAAPESRDEEEAPPSPEARMRSHMQMLRYHLDRAGQLAEDAATLAREVDSVTWGALEVPADQFAARLESVRGSLRVAASSFWQVTDDLGAAPRRGEA